MRLNLNHDLSKGAFSIIMLLMLTPVFSSTINIPDEYSTIQSGIEAAGNGDTIIVAPNTYFENINFKGKTILLTSYYLYEADSQFINNTIIDGSTYTNSDSASTVIFNNGEGENSILQGFTITGGSGTAWVDPQLPNFTWFSGGGIFIYYASPTIRNNIITSNLVENNGDFDGASGGGLLCFRGNPLICNNTFSNNQADYGAGLVTDYSGARIRNNLIICNTGGQQYGGGGIYSIGTDTEPILICNNVIYGNYSQTTGGAIQLWSSSVTAKNNILWANTQNSGGCINGSSINITYSVIENGYSGEGNLTVDPQIIDFTTFQISSSSPCVDTGDPTAEYNDPEDPGNPGYALYPSLGTTRNDIGAYGGPFTCNWEMTSADEILTEQGNILIKELKAFPNPFNPSGAGSGPKTVISCQLSDLRHTNASLSPQASISSLEEIGLEIFNIKGQKIKDLPLSSSQFNGFSQSQLPSLSATWDGRDSFNNCVPSGVYFYKISINNQSKVKTMILLK